MPEVSVIVPVYNVEKYLKNCLVSILNQTFKDIELICIDDGSTDQSMHVLEQIAARDERMHIFTQENQGVSIARNKGLSFAKGKWCLFVDSDDAIHPQTVELCLHFAHAYDADLVCFGFQRTDGSAYPYLPIDAAQIDIKVSDTPLSFALSKGKFRIPFSASTKFYKTEIARQVDFVKGIYYEDGPHTYALLSKHPQTVVLDAVLYFYTQNASSISHIHSNQKQLLDYRIIMHYLNDIYFHSTYTADILIIRRFLFPKYLNNQWKCCRKSAAQDRLQMLKIFAESLREYKEKNMITLTGCGLFKYLKYLFIMKKY